MKYTVEADESYESEEADFSALRRISYGTLSQKMVRFDTTNHQGPVRIGLKIG